MFVAWPCKFPYLTSFFDLLCSTVLGRAFSRLPVVAAVSSFYCRQKNDGNSLDGGGGRLVTSISSARKKSTTIQQARPFENTRESYCDFPLVKACGALAEKKWQREGENKGNGK